MYSLPPANEVCEGYVFTGVSVHSGEGACVVVGGGMGGRGGMCDGRGMCVGGACMAGGAWQGGHAWQGCAWQGACVVIRACVAGETATAAGGTHPTGMYSCLYCRFTLTSAESSLHLFKDSNISSHFLVIDSMESSTGCITSGNFWCLKFTNFIKLEHRSCDTDTEILMTDSKR